MAAWSERVNLPVSAEGSGDAGRHRDIRLTLFLCALKLSRELTTPDRQAPDNPLDIRMWRTVAAAARVIARAARRSPTA